MLGSLEVGAKLAASIRSSVFSNEESGREVLTFGTWSCRTST